MKEKWWRWPQTIEHPNIVPWYMVLRRALFIVPRYIFGALTALCLLLGWGVIEARQFWKENFR